MDMNDLKNKIEEKEHEKDPYGDRFKYSSPGRSVSSLYQREPSDGRRGCDRRKTGGSNRYSGG